MPATLPFHGRSSGEARSSLPVRALSAAGLFLMSVWHEWRLRRDRRMLEALGERELHDIGIGRGQIDGAVRFGRPRQPAPAEIRWSLWRSASHG